MDRFDYIVIGAGSAGCVVANRLTEDCNVTVLLLEAGNPDTKPEIQIPGECLELIGSEVDWGYFSESEPYLNDRKMFCSRGKVLGGSSSINAMVYVRGNPHDYDHWQELGNPGWSYHNVLPYFKKSEHSSRGADAYHGMNGELSVTDPTAPATISQKFVDACVALGYGYNPDFKDTPMIWLNHLQSQSDVQKLVAGVKLMRQLFDNSAFDEFRGEEIAPSAQVQSDAALVAYIRAYCNTGYHFVGTCKMGTAPMAVVDPELRVHGVEGLRVVDASIMPTLITGHTNAPTIMIGEKAADLIKAAHYSQQRLLALA